MRRAVLAFVIFVCALLLHGSASKRRTWYADQAVRAANEGRYKNAAELLEEAIRLNSGDAGATYEPFPEQSLSDADLAHGEEQLRRLLVDRPVMAVGINESDVLWRWARDRFAGRGGRSRVDWDRDEPLRAQAACGVPGPSGRPTIRISKTYGDGPRKGEDRAFEELWSDLVFEMHNALHLEEYPLLEQQAAEGTVSREDFVRRKYAMEHRTRERTRAFYARVFLAWAEARRFRTNPLCWETRWWGTAEEAMGAYTDEDAFPWYPYGDDYDRIAHGDDKGDGR